jgi:hypothetical protein
MVHWWVSTFTLAIFLAIFFVIIAELKQFFNLGAGGRWSTLTLFCVLLKSCP